VHNEIKAGVLAKDGWDEKTILKIFNLEFGPSYVGPNDNCDTCGECFLYKSCVVEPRWYNFIENIKIGSYRGSEGVVEEPTSDSNRRLTEESIVVENNKSFDNRSNRCCQRENKEETYQVQAESLESVRNVGGQNDFWQNEASENEESDIKLCWYCWYNNVNVSLDDKTTEELSDDEELSDYEDSPLLLSL